MGPGGKGPLLAEFWGFICVPEKPTNPRQVLDVGSRDQGRRISSHHGFDVFDYQVCRVNGAACPFDEFRKIGPITKVRVDDETVDVIQRNFE